MPNAYLQSLLASQELSKAERAEVDAHANEIESFLREEFGQEPVIKKAGSISKGTAVKDSYDLDMVIYFPSTDARSLKQIYDDVDAKLSKRYSIELKNSAIRIRNLTTNGDNYDYHIDVVPGRFIADSKDVFLHIRNGDKERIQTNLKTHIDYIVSSGCQDVIKLTKIWKIRNKISFRTFILELLVVKTLEGFKDKSNLEAAFTKALETLSGAMRIELVDPANSGNVVSQLLEDHDKKLISSAASKSLEVAKGNSNQKWQEIFREENQRQTIQVKQSSGAFTPQAPWSDSCS